MNVNDTIIRIGESVLYAKMIDPEHVPVENHVEVWIW